MVRQITLQFKLAFIIGPAGAFPYAICFEFLSAVRACMKDSEAKGSRGLFLGELPVLVMLLSGHTLLTFVHDQLPRERIQF